MIMAKEYVPLVPYLYNVGDVVNGLEIINQTYALDTHGWKSKAYYVKCTKCGYEYDTPKREGNLKKYGCIVCTGKKVVPGINDIATTAPWMVKYFENPEDATKYTYSSNKKINMICPYCGKDKKKLTPNTLYRKGFGCAYCGDGISYPEKFIRNLLDELNIDYIFQLSKKDFNWCENYRYDFYIPSKNIIIETHGRQHYEDAFSSNFIEQERIDLIKRESALNNGIKQYIQLDCRESNKQWIIDSIINSNLDEILEFNYKDIDWNKIEYNSLNSILLESCILWEQNELLTTYDIGKMLHINGDTIHKYLIKGSEIGICNYSSELGKYRRGLKSAKNISMVCSKKIFYDNKIYDSISSFANSINKSPSVVGRWIGGNVLPRNYNDRKFLSAHYATNNELEKYSNYSA